MKLDLQFIQEINRFKTIYCLVSGGFHSTASALLLKDHGFENVVLLHNKTHLEMKSALKTMDKLQAMTHYEYIEIEPNLKSETIWDIMKASFQKIPEIIHDVELGQYDRKKIPCCNKLKKYSTKKYFQKIPDHHEKIVIINSITSFEGPNRVRHLTDLRNLNTFLRFHKRNGGIWTAYPFRDAYTEKPFLPYLRSKGFHKIKHSGCVICPLAIVFKKYKSPQYYPSLKAMARAGLPCFQKFITDFTKN